MEERPCCSVIAHACSSYVISLNCNAIYCYRPKRAAEPNSAWTMGRYHVLAQAVTRHASQRNITRQAPGFGPEPLSPRALCTMLTTTLDYPLPDGGCRTSNDRPFILLSCPSPSTFERRARCRTPAARTEVLPARHLPGRTVLPARCPSSEFRMPSIHTL